MIDTVLPVATVFVAYAATGDWSERFAASAATTLTRVRVEASEIVAAVVRSYVRDDGTVSVPPIVTVRGVMSPLEVPLAGSA